MSRKLKTLREANEAARAHSWDDGGPRPKGIACPSCGAELLDSTPNMVLTSNPAQLNIHCPKCGFRSYRTI